MPTPLAVKSRAELCHLKFAFAHEDAFKGTHSYHVSLGRSLFEECVLSAKSAMACTVVGGRRVLNQAYVPCDDR